MTAAPSSTATAGEKMDSIYRYQRYIYDATRAHYLLGRDRLIADLDVPAGGSVLEIGCGTGRNLFAAAQRYPASSLCGLDVSTAMLQTAQSTLKRRRLALRVTLAVGDATDFDSEHLFGRPALDRVFISYALSMIPAWPEVVEGGIRCLAPNGQLHIVDFGDFARYPAVLRRGQLAWLSKFSVTPIVGLSEQLSAIAGRNGLIARCTPLYGGYAMLATLARPQFN